MIQATESASVHAARHAENLVRTAPLESVGGYHVRINDRPNFDILRKDIFERRCYHFDSTHPDPLILDAGGNIGLSVLYFKREYPKARIITFEPDPMVLPFLHENLRGNELTDVTVVEAALSSRQDQARFFADGKYGGALARAVAVESVGIPMNVPCVRLRDYLQEPIDFLKMNIEGAEWEVLEDSADSLGRVREMVIEYHHLPGLPRTLHDILALLHRTGFEYLLNDFDAETNPYVRPPFRLQATSRYFLLIYARRRDTIT